MSIKLRSKDVEAPFGGGQTAPDAPKTICHGLSRSAACGRRRQSSSGFRRSDLFLRGKQTKQMSSSMSTKTIWVSAILRRFLKPFLRRRTRLNTFFRVRLALSIPGGRLSLAVLALPMGRWLELSAKAWARGGKFRTIPRGGASSLFRFWNAGRRIPFENQSWFWMVRGRPASMSPMRQPNFQNSIT